MCRLKCELQLKAEAKIKECETRKDVLEILRVLGDLKDQALKKLDGMIL